MALVTQDLSCTGTGNASVVRNPTKVLSSTGTSVPKLVKSVSRIYSVTGTAVPILLKLPQKVLSVVATHGILISVMSFGIDTFDVFEGKRKWIVNGVDRFQFNTKKRFTFLVRGKPYG